MARLLVLQNADNAPLALVGDALAACSVETDIRLLESGQAVLPSDSSGYDGLVVLGGHQDAFDDVASPFLSAEMALIRSFHGLDKPVMGICLGAQLVARAFGGQVFRNPAGLEWGFTPFALTEAGKADPLLADGGLPPIMQCHIDTYTLPDGAVRLASNTHTLEQAYRLGRACYGFQFHFEVTRPIVTEWEAEMAPRYDWNVDDAARHMDEAFERHFDQAAAFALRVTQRWLALAA